MGRSFCETVQGSFSPEKAEDKTEWMVLHEGGRKSVREEMTMLGRYGADGVNTVK